MEGTILSYSKNVGKLRGDDEKVYKFNRRAITVGKIDDATPGRRVRFILAGKRASEVELLEEIVAVATMPIMNRQPRSDRFLNPYNFVRPLEVADESVAPLLGRCPPPPHDRYVGLTGRITCGLTAKTPLFVSDSEGIEPTEIAGGKKHYTYRFFRDPSGQIAIPGTSLRGAFRSIFEAVTNSCFNHFAQDKRLSYHLPATETWKLVPGRVRQVNETDWEIDILPGTTSYSANQRPEGPQYAAWVLQYRSLQSSKTRQNYPSTPYVSRSKVSLGTLTHRDPCQALIEEVSHPKRKFSFWNVVAIAPLDETLPRPTAIQKVVQGYLCITNQNIDNKHDERFLFRTDSNKSIANSLPLSPTVRQRYNELIQDYQERHTDDIEKRRKDGPPNKAYPNRDPKKRKSAYSRHLLDRKVKKEKDGTLTYLHDGDLVYAMLEPSRSSYEVSYLVPVSVPRVGYERTIGQLLEPSQLRACDDYKHLCPACRTFGWVWEKSDPAADDPPLEKRTAYAGRVTFTHAERKDPASCFEATLSILSTPKPTTTRFYLTPRQGNPRKGREDSQVGYDASDQILRGRKVYRHHGGRLNENEYQSVNGQKSDQNRTVKDVQGKGTTFEFEVRFENLAEVELGALLWTLELEGWHHRLGYGKPLGFGSATVEIKTLEFLNIANGYKSLEGSRWIDGLEDKEFSIEYFKDSMWERYKQDFSQLPNVRDLEALLAKTPLLPVHYPRPAQMRDPEGKNYEWFVGNKRSGRDAGPRLELPLAVEDRKGLPILDKRGNEVLR